MRKTNNIDTINLAADAEEGRTFWILYDMDTQETLTSIDFDKHEWKPITLSTGDNWGLSEILPTARFSTLEEAQEVGDEAADRLSEEYPDDEINLEIHMVSLEMVEMVRTVIFAGKAKRFPDSDDQAEEDEGEVDLVEEEEEEDYCAPSRSISSSRWMNASTVQEVYVQGEDVHFTPISGWGAEEDKKPKKAKKSTKNGKKGRA